MAKYTLKRIGKHGGKVEVRSQHMEFHVPAFIICAVLAFLIWIYIVGISKIAVQPPRAHDTEAAETKADTGASAEAVFLPTTPLTGREDRGFPAA